MFQKIYHKLRLLVSIFLKYKNGYMFILDKLNLVRSKNVIYKTKSGIKYITRTSTTDFAILNETIILNQYLKYGISSYLNKYSTVLDFGAQIGDFSVYVAYKFGSKVYSFEPEHENFELLTQNIKLNELENKVFPIKAAITNETGQKYLKLSGWQNKGVHSFHYIEGGELTLVNTVNILEISKNFDSVDLLKIDIEGGEHDLFIPQNKEFFKKVNTLVMEYHCQKYVTNSKGINNLIKVAEEYYELKLLKIIGTEELGIIYFIKSNASLSN